MDELRQKKLRARVEKLKTYSSEDVAVDAARTLNKAEKGWLNSDKELIYLSTVS